MRATAACISKIVRISPHEWPELRDIFQKDWPKHSFAYYSLSSYIEWSKKDQEMCERCIEIWSVDENWREHGLFVLEDRTQLSHTIQLDCCVLDGRRIITAVRNIKPSGSYSSLVYREHTRCLIEKMLDIKDSESGLDATALVYLSRKQALKLEIRPIVGFDVRPLKPENVKRINEVWTCNYPDSDYLIERIIKNNVSLGAYDEQNGNLAAWVLQTEVGTIGMLQVEESYKRSGIGEHLVGRLSVKLAQLGLDVIANIIDSNTASSKLFQKLGFQPIDRVYWYTNLNSIKIRSPAQSA